MYPMRTSTVTCEIWDELRISNSSNYKIFFKGEILVVNSKNIIFIVPNTKDFFIELNKMVDMGQFSKIIIENSLN